LIKKSPICGDTMKEYTMEEMYKATKESLMLNYVIILKFLTEKYGEDVALEFGEKMASWSANYRVGFLKKTLIKSLKMISQKQLVNILIKNVIEGMQYVLPTSHVTIETKEEGITIIVKDCPLKKEMKKLIKKFEANYPTELYCRTWCRSLFREYLTELAKLKFTHELGEKGCIIKGLSK